MKRYKFTIILAATLAIFFIVAEVGGARANSHGLMVVLPNGSDAGDANAWGRLYYWLLASRYVALGAGLCAAYGAAIGVFVDWVRNQDGHEI